MGKAIRASALIVLLACSAQAGIMGNDSPAPPASAGWMGNESPAPAPSQTTSAVQEPATGGETTTGEIPNDTAGTLTQLALELLAVLPPLL